MKRRYFGLDHPCWRQGRNQPIRLGFATDYNVVYHSERRYQLGSRLGVEHGPSRVFVGGNENNELLRLRFILSESATVLGAEYVEGASSDKKT